jgi:hypothetical protein
MGPTSQVLNSALYKMLQMVVQSYGSLYMSQGNYLEGDNMDYKTSIVVMEKQIQSRNYLIAPHINVSQGGQQCSPL